VVYAIRESRRGLARTYPRSLRRCPFFFPFSFFFFTLLPAPVINVARVRARRCETPKKERRFTLNPRACISGLPRGGHSHWEVSDNLPRPEP